MNGHRIENDTHCFFSETTRIRPMRDGLIVEPLEWKPSSIIDVETKAKPLRGVVKAVGPGHYPTIYDTDNRAKRKKAWSSMSFRPTTIKVGQTVELGGLELGGYLFTTLTWGGKRHLMCREQDVCVVYD